MSQQNKQTPPDTTVQNNSTTNTALNPPNSDNPSTSSISNVRVADLQAEIDKMRHSLADSDIMMIKLEQLCTELKKHAAGEQQLSALRELRESFDENKAKLRKVEMELESLLSEEGVYSPS